MHPKSTLQLVTHHSARNQPFHWPPEGAVFIFLHRPCLPTCGLALIYLMSLWQDWPHWTWGGGGCGRPPEHTWHCHLGWEDTPSTFSQHQLQMSVALWGQSELSACTAWMDAPCGELGWGAIMTLTPLPHHEVATGAQQQLLVVVGPPGQ